MLASKIELDPPLRARLCVDELPGSIAERRHVGVVHVSDIIHDEGIVQSAKSARAIFSSQSYHPCTEHESRTKEEKSDRDVE